MDLMDEKPEEFDFVSALATKALEMPSGREPAGKAVDSALQELKEAQKRGRQTFEQQQGRATKTANKIWANAGDEEKEAAAAGVEGARALIEEYRSLKGFTYRDILEAGGYNKPLTPEKMGTSEMITRISMATLPALAGYLLGGGQNRYASAAGAAEAGVKGLAYLDQLDKEKRDRTFKQRETLAKAALQEAKDERQLMREALVMPQKARLQAQELGKQIQLAAAKEGISKSFEMRKETPEELAARERLRQATDLEEALLRSQRERFGKKKLGVAAESYIRKTAPVLATRAKTVSAIESAITQLEDPKISEEQKVLVGNSLLKQMNDPDNPDALQQAEAARLNPYLQYQMFNILPGSPGAMFGRDLPQFTEQLKNFRERLLTGYETLSKDVAEIEATGELPKYKPGQTKTEKVAPEKQVTGPITLTKEIYDRMSDKQKAEFNAQKDRAKQQAIIKQVIGAK